MHDKKARRLGRALKIPNHFSREGSAMQGWNAAKPRRVGGRGSGSLRPAVDTPVRRPVELMGPLFWFDFFQPRHIYLSSVSPRFPGTSRINNRPFRRDTTQDPFAARYSMKFSTKSRSNARRPSHGAFSGGHLQSRHLLGRPKIITPNVWRCRNDYESGQLTCTGGE